VHASLIVSGLWAGPYRSLEEIDQMEGLQTIISILPIAQIPCDGSAATIRQWLARTAPHIRHRILVTSDTEPNLSPEYISHVVSFAKVPTLIHCNGGRNRSSMLAACWLLFYRKAASPEQALEIVKTQRLPQFKEAPGRRFYLDPAMIQTVHRFAAWLKENR